ncbi:MAG: threonylcarbamoyl-AMP synthase [Holosporales bacterium]|jgi:L-threonylcarbamoyladenylate synthase|nr:threonylcarbamoyl-AMP synthase [Holosporales bacterium]
MYDQNLVSFVSKAASAIGEGGIVVAPTDTVYGLLADATNQTAVKNVFRIKQRPASKPLPVLICNIAMAEKFLKLSYEATKVAHHFWIEEKRPLTIVVSLLEPCHEIVLAESVRAGGSTVAIRLPNSKFLVDVITKLGRPLVAPSANIHGQPPATNYHSAVTAFGHYISDTFMIVDGGTSECSLSSTIIDCSRGSYQIIREGPVSENEIVEFVRSL